MLSGCEESGWKHQTNYISGNITSFVITAEQHLFGIIRMIIINCQEVLQYDEVLLNNIWSTLDEFKHVNIIDHVNVGDGSNFKIT